MFESLEVNAEHIPAYKLAAHLAQILFAIVLWILEIVVFRAKDAPVTGSIGWTFAVVFLSIPAWIYLAMAPRFPRTRRFAEPRAMAVVDGFFAIVWLSAFATQASYNTAGLCGSVCGVSKAIVGLGFFVFLFFCISTFISIWTIQYWKWNNRLPGYDKASRSGDPNNIDPDKAAFSMAPHGDDAYAPVNMNDHDNDPEIPLGGGIGGGIGGGGVGAHSDYADPYGAPRHSPDPYGGPSSVGPAGSSYGGSVTGRENPFRDENPFDDDSSYNPGGRASAMGSMGSRYTAPTVHDDYDARFPTANYDRITR